MKFLSWSIGIIAFALTVHSYCSENKKNKEDKPVYLENIYFGLYNGATQEKVKELAEYILSTHGIHADINVSL